MKPNGQQPADPSSGPSREDLWRVMQVLVPLQGLSVHHALYVLTIAKDVLSNLQRVNLTDDSFVQFARDMAPAPVVPTGGEADKGSSPVH